MLKLARARLLKETVNNCDFLLNPPERGSTEGSWPTCPLAPACKFNMQQPMQGVSNRCTPPHGALEIPPRGHARLDHPPLWRRPHRETSVWTLVPAPPPSRQPSQLAPLDQPSLVRRARTYPWWETTGTFFSPQTPSGLGDDRASTRLFFWDTTRATRGTGANTNRSPGVAKNVSRG